MADASSRVEYVKSSDGATIAMSRRGSGHPVVDVPAMFTGLGAEAFFEAQLPSDIELITFDRRGSGLSERVPATTSGQLLLDDLRAVVRAIDAPSYSMLGTGLGALEAVGVAATDERVDRLALAGPALFGAEFLARPGVQALRSTLKIDWEFFTQAFFAWAVQWHATAPDRAAAMQSYTTPEAADAYLESLNELDNRGVLRDIKAKTIVVHRPTGRSRSSHARQIASEIPDCGLIVAHDGRSFGDEYATAMGWLTQHSEQRPSPEGSIRTLLFTDLESSTALTQRVGDEAAQLVLARHNAAVRAALERNEGREIKHTGDGIMASFVSAVAAVTAALEMQAELATSGVRVRVGLNTGEPIAEDGDLFGTTVQLAARICDRAEPGQVLVSRVVAELCAGKRFEFGHMMDATLKGFAESVGLYEATWRPA